MDRSDPRPTPIFTREELRYLQDLLDREREGWFNYKMELLAECDSSDEADAKWGSAKWGLDTADGKYRLAKALRNKVYHLGGRDTLALGEPAEQRHWDQQHDY